MEKSPLSKTEESGVEKSVPHQNSNMIAVTEHYTIAGRRFDVERVFCEDAHDTIATVLLKLIWAATESQ